MIEVVRPATHYQLDLIRCQVYLLESVLPDSVCTHQVSGIPDNEWLALQDCSLSSREDSRVSLKELLSRKPSVTGSIPARGEIYL
jgi:hypothetical protein